MVEIKIPIYNVKCRDCNKFYPRVKNRRYCPDCDKRLSLGFKRNKSKKQYWERKRKGQKTYYYQKMN